MQMLDSFTEVSWLHSNQFHTLLLTNGSLTEKLLAEDSFIRSHSHDYTLTKDTGALREASVDNEARGLRRHGDKYTCQQMVDRSSLSAHPDEVTHM